MANKEQIARRKQELTTQLANNRASISRNRERLKERLKVKPLLLNWVKTKPKSIFAGSAIAGLGAALFLRRPRRSKKSSQSMSLIILGWTLSLLKPAAQAWVMTRAKEAAASTNSYSPPQR